ncbi:MAG: phosphate/phosphite/phosphonate ABC transporter substrate-binding protein [Pseudomonadota bacterium]
MPHPQRIAAILLAVFAVLALNACHSGEGSEYTPTFAPVAASAEPVYVFGVHPLHNPQRLHEVFGPLMAYLSTRIDGARFRLEASRNYAAYDEKLYARQFHFALPNPYQTINAVKQGYRVFGKMGDDENFRGIILVRKDSGIREVRDLRGKAVSYPAPSALAATMLPQYFLHSHGIDVMHDVDNRYVGSQESSIMNVYLGDVAAGATWPPPWRALSRERPELAAALEVRWQTDPLPNNGLVVLPDVPVAIVAQVERLLFSLHESAEGRALLSRMELSRFEPADNATYQPVREFIRRFSAEVRPVE